jgi:hypothetical protein
MWGEERYAERVRERKERKGKRKLDKQSVR